MSTGRSNDPVKGRSADGGKAAINAEMAEVLDITRKKQLQNN